MVTLVIPVCCAAVDGHASWPIGRPAISRSVVKAKSNLCNFPIATTHIPVLLVLPVFLNFTNMQNPSQKDRS